MKDKWIQEKDGSLTNVSLIERMRKSGALKRLRDSFMKEEYKWIFGDKHSKSQPKNDNND